MAGFDSLESRVFTGPTVHTLGAEGRKAVRASEDIDDLLSVRSMLRIAAAGRGLWLLAAWLLVLSGVWVTAEGVVAILVLGIWFVALVAIIGYVSRTRHRANAASEWLSEVDYRLAQLAARPEGRDLSQP